MLENYDYTTSIGLFDEVLLHLLWSGHIKRYFSKIWETSFKKRVFLISDEFNQKLDTSLANKYIVYSL